MTKQSYPPELLTKAGVAHLLSANEWKVGELVRRGVLTPVDDGGKWVKFRLSEVRAYIDSLPDWNKKRVVKEQAS